MTLVYAVLGGVVLIAVMTDLLWTTLWVAGGAGPLTARLMTETWRTLRRLGNDDARVLSLAGPAILLLGLTMWITLLWGGWTLVFAGAEQNLIDTRGPGPVSWSERLYFVGYSIFTLGNGDFAPRDGLWQIATALATASGMLFVTLIVTYVLSVLDAVTQKRAFASGVTGLGASGEDVLRMSWSGEQFEGLDLPLNTLTSQLNELTANHNAYPILHYFYSPQVEQAPAIGVAVLDETLTLLRFGIPASDRPSKPIIRNARASVGNYLNTLHTAFIQPADEAPPSPSLTSLRHADIPTVSDETFAKSLTGQDERRRTLRGLVEADAHDWPSTSTP